MIFVAPNVDLSFSEDEKGTVNITGHITEESMNIGFPVFYEAFGVWMKNLVNFLYAQVTSVHSCYV